MRAAVGIAAGPSGTSLPPLPPLRSCHGKSPDFHRRTPAAQAVGASRRPSRLAQNDSGHPGSRPRSSSGGPSPPATRRQPPERRDLLLRSPVLQAWNEAPQCEPPAVRPTSLPYPGRSASFRHPVPASRCRAGRRKTACRSASPENRGLPGPGEPADTPAPRAPRGAAAPWANPAGSCSTHTGPAALRPPRGSPFPGRRSSAVPFRSGRPGRAPRRAGFRCSHRA